jgi:hypothetical protein
MGGALTVVNGAKMSCTLGGGISLLIVTTPSSILVEGQPPATIQDHLPIVNVPPFAGCAVSPHVCVPVLPAPWIVPMFTGVQLSTLGSPILPANGRLMCSIGGVISILDPNEHTVPVGEANLMISQMVDAELEIEAIKDELKHELMKAGLDVAGTFDPTPILDGLSAYESLKDGDFLGAGLSGLSMIPYLGDAFGKGPKAARLISKVNKLRERMAAAKALRRVRRVVPPGWAERASKRGGGREFINPEAEHQRVRFQPGNPKNEHPNSRKPYVKVTDKGGNTLMPDGSKTPPFSDVKTKKTYHHVGNKHHPDAHQPAHTFKGNLGGE